MTEKNLQELEQEQKVDETQEEVKTEKTKIEEKAPDRNQLLRELSKEYGVNLFDPEGIKAFKDYQDSQKTELERIREELEAVKARESETLKELETQRLNTLRIKHNIDENKFADFLAIATAKTSDTVNIEQAFEETVKEYGQLFVNQTQRDGIKLGLEVQTENPQGEKVKSFDQEVYDAFLRRRGRK